MYARQKIMKSRTAKRGEIKYLEKAKRTGKTGRKYCSTFIWNRRISRGGNWRNQQNRTIHTSTYQSGEYVKRRE